MTRVETRGRKSLFDAEKRKQIAERYAAGETLTELAKDYGCVASTIWHVVRDRFPTRPENRGRKSLFDVEARRKIAKRYAAGETLEGLAKDYDCVSSTIWHVVRNLGVPKRPNSQKFLNPNQERKVIERYAAGETLKALAKDYGCSDMTIHKTVRGIVFPTRPQTKGLKSSLDAGKRKQVAKRYAAGETTEGLAKEYGCSTATIYYTLHNLGVQIHSKFNADEQRKIAKRYAAGEPMAKLVQDYNCNLETIRKIVRRLGGSLRSVGWQPNAPRGPMKFNADERRKIAERYAAGETLEGLAKDYGCGHTTVFRIVRRFDPWFMGTL